jgi:hypothetical protein
MKCREFETVVRDLARGREDEAFRNAAGHASVCARCADRLAAEREVSQALRTFAESMRGRGAPERVEKALAAAFSAQPAPQARGMGRAPYWWILAAAAAVAVLLFAVRPHTARPPVAPQPIVAARSPVASAPVSIAPQPPRRPVKRKAVRAAATPPKLRRHEIATRYYPLRYVDDAGDFESGAVVRMQVPRTLLVSFGLPIDEDRASEPVQADVVLDETGLARAIRFVRRP